MRYVTLPESFRPEYGWCYSCLEGKADCEPYTRHGSGLADVRWCKFLRIAPGSASIYPVKLQVPGRGEGQFKLEEVTEWRFELSVLDALVEMDRTKQLMPYFIDRSGSAIPPGIDPEWAWDVTERIPFR